MPDDSGAEKTFDPTPERVKKAHDEGQFAFSKEVVTALSFLGSLLWFAFARQSLQMQTEGCLKDYLSFSRYLSLNASDIGPFLLGALGYTVRIAGPLLGLALVVGLAASVSQVGFHVASKKKFFDLTRLDPAAGFTRLFSLSHVFEGAKAVLKALLFALLCYWTVAGSRDQILVMGSMPPSQALETAIAIALKVVFRAGLLMIVLGIVDYVFQWRQYRKKLMMSHQEIKEEHKESEGDPTNRRRQRSMQMDVSRNRMISAVRKADVVVTNPTHYAVALKYDADTGGAPKLLAKGARLMAQRIKDEARRHHVPIVEDKFVARSIYFGVKVGQEIPQSLYRAVAEILAYVYHLAGKSPRRRPHARRRTATA